MYIDREHYMDLLKKIDTLQREREFLGHQNTLLVRELEREKVVNFQLYERFNVMEEKMISLNSQLMNQSEANHCDIKGQMIKINQDQRKLIQTKFSQLQSSSFEKYKVLEIKNRVNRFQNHDLSSFCEKVKKIYKQSCEGSSQPSFKDLVKWIKVIAKQGKGLSSKQGMATQMGKSSKSKEETSSSWKQNKKVKN